MCRGGLRLAVTGVVRRKGSALSWHSCGVLDPHEGVAPDGTIRTGVDRNSVQPAFESLLGELVTGASAAGPSVSTYLYGSVATGMARLGISDVDILTVGLSRQRATALQEQLNRRFAGVSRGVEIAVASPEDYLGHGDEAYGNRVFLRHYCVHVAGPDARATLSDFPADARAARGFNGDIGRHHRDWVEALRG